jgi:hypothetical protein
VVIGSVLPGAQDADRDQGQQEDEDHQEEGVRRARAEVGGRDVVIEVQA